MNQDQENTQDDAAWFQAERQRWLHGDSELLAKLQAERDSVQAQLEAFPAESRRTALEDAFSGKPTKLDLQVTKLSNRCFEDLGLSSDSLRRAKACQTRQRELHRLTRQCVGLDELIEANS